MSVEKMKDFVDSVPSTRWCSIWIAESLKNKGYVELEEGEPWEKHKSSVKGIYVIRGSSIIAVKLPRSLKGFTGTLTHSDSPHYKIKLNPEMRGNGYTKLNVEPYGGMIHYSWLDKPLSICGTIATSNGLEEIDTMSDVQVLIPSQAIHINRDVNSVNNLNPQKDMLPVFAISDSKEQGLGPLFTDMGYEDIITMDLALYNPEPVKILSLGSAYNNVIMGPRLDNLASVYAALEGFLENDSEQPEDFAEIFVAFNSEEIGSTTHDGADGNFLSSVLERLCNVYGVDKYSVFANSMLLSIDATHAIHPNAPEKSDPTNIVRLGSGIVIKHNSNYANDIELEVNIKNICRLKKIPYQDYYCRSDMKCGGTLGNISMSHHGIPTIDIGIPMLGMHSAVETIASDDVEYLLQFLKVFYEAYAKEILEE